MVIMMTRMMMMTMMKNNNNKHKTVTYNKCARFIKYKEKLKSVVCTSSL